MLPLRHTNNLVMLRLCFRSAPTIRHSFLPRTAFSVVRTMSSGSKNNDDFKSSKLFDVSHITAVVTGGGTGIGLMITQALVANGAKVYITGRRKEALETTSKEYNTGPGRIIP